MRRLPVFFLLDCSESMVGDKLDKVQEGIQKVVSSLRSNPYALETVYVSAIAFAGISKTIAPLVELPMFYPPKLPIGGGTNLGAGLDQLMVEIDRNVVKTTSEQKGDWKPIVYLLTDGRPTDESASSVARWNAEYRRRTKLIAIGIGESVDFAVLRSLTDTVLAISDLDHDLKGLFDWVSASVQLDCKAASTGVESSTNGPPTAGPVRLVKDVPPSADESCVTLIGRCQKSKRPYLMRYDRLDQKVATSDFSMDVASFHLSGCHPLSEDYFIWSGKLGAVPKIDANKLVGVPGCPYCGNISAFAVCSCGGLMCVGGPGASQCPWCDQLVEFGGGAAGDVEFEVARGRG